MTHASLFSGIGGPEVAAAMLGWENLFHCEINPFGRKVLEYWFPDSVSYEDITKTSFKEWRGKVDVLSGGFPCQPFSYAGKRGGADDTRYLWPQMLRAIDEIRPAWVVGENVAGLATMVEGGVLADLGCYATLFQEGDELHGYELEQSFTIERICGDLERLGYSVQPVLIPAAAVGAPHRRDRIFILAFDADADRRNDVRGSGEDEGKGREERLQERNEIREPGKSDPLRPSLLESSPDARRGSRESKCNLEGGESRGDGPLCYGSKRASSNTEERCGDGRFTKCAGDSKQPEQEFRDGHSKAAASDTECRRRRTFDEQMESKLADWAGLERDGRERYATNSDGTGREKSQQPWRGKDQAQDGSRLHDRIERPCGDGFLAGMSPELRWAGFPTVSPIHRGNDGLPFNVDDLTISFSRWRTESLKAYGNAIVPQVMYRIFEAIESITINTTKK